MNSSRASDSRSRQTEWDSSHQFLDHAEEDDPEYQECGLAKVVRNCGTVLMSFFGLILLLVVGIALLSMALIVVIVPLGAMILGSIYLSPQNCPASTWLSSLVSIQGVLSFSSGALYTLNRNEFCFFVQLVIGTIHTAAFVGNLILTQILCRLAGLLPFERTMSRDRWGHSVWAEDNYCDMTLFTFTSVLAGGYWIILALACFIQMSCCRSQIILFKDTIMNFLGLGLKRVRPQALSPRQNPQTDVV